VTENGYDALVNDIASLYEERIGRGVQQRNAQLVASYWDIGDMIVRGEKDVKPQGRYGKKLLEQLSVDLTERFGSGFCRTNMFNIRRFRLAYRRSALHPFLTWTHYLTLLKVTDVRRRKRLEETAIREQLSDKQFKLLVRSSNGVAMAKSEKMQLEPRKGRPFVYRVVKEMHDSNQLFLVDCGFQVKRKVQLKGVRGVAEGDMLACTKTEDAGYRFSRTECGVGERYCYHGTLLDVVDGDTVVIRVDLGFDTFVDDRFRLRGVDAPEIATTGGKRAKQFVMRRVKPDSAVLLFTYGCDMYGRYLADVFYHSGNAQGYPTVTSGCFLNMELLEKGMAGYWDALRWK
jgi:endonuclease YncB( thermonuclease family)